MCPDKDCPAQILRSKGEYANFLDPVMQAFDPFRSVRIFYGLDDRPSAFQRCPRHGYHLKDLVDQFDTRPAEIKAFLNNTLDPARAAELRDKMLAVGLPI